MEPNVLPVVNVVPRALKPNVLPVVSLVPRAVESNVLPVVCVVPRAVEAIFLLSHKQLESHVLLSLHQESLSLTIPVWQPNLHLLYVHRRDQILKTKSEP